MSEVRPYGSWSSPISAAMTAAAGVGLGQVTVVGEVAWWVERRPSEAGRQVLVRGGPHEAPRDVTPSGFDVRTRVHEYGGGDYCLPWVIGEPARLRGFQGVLFQALEG